MADTDFKSSLPVRSEADGADARVQVKVVDKTNPGTQQMIVDSDSNAHVEIHGNDPLGVDRVARLAENGAVQSDGVYDGTGNTKPSHQGVVLQERNAAAADSRQTMRPTAKRGSVDTDVVSADVALHDEHGNAYTPSNPLPVAISPTEAGTPAVDFVDSSGAFATGVPKDTTYTRTFTVAGSAFTLKKITASSTARAKVEILWGAAGSEARKYVKATSHAVGDVEFEPAVKVTLAVGETILVKFTNLDQQAASMFSTIEGQYA
jgi:hypothetical protein